MSFLPGFSHGYTSIAWSHSLDAPGRQPFSIRPVSPAVARTTDQTTPHTARDLIMEAQTGRIANVTA
ncbi:hypothetical protein [Desulfolutivibrio sulfoxidireducens]|uniref:hypothetical protein n=1 Tax=Desulfolutivibrio sulfoxidireducens TaxID=2773299 RepID=UPI00159EACFA|nr:hypothetical protein [Desulfolutivibrio sulfoxidireducens]QLA14882.1 hypothetical protein GD605_01330 [Desulfolutivibrio sulfoxidireducens]QLA18451.1 hypothetical protein GD604_01265 [Desulfolutivibrio sulfoxidireducens]